MRKVDNTIALPIYYSLHHDKKLTVKTLFYAQLLYEIISLQTFAMSKKRTFTYTYLVFLFSFLTSIHIKLTKGPVIIYFQGGAAKCKFGMSKHN
jgi:hypothetical protein